MSKNGFLAGGLFGFALGLMLALFTGIVLCLWVGAETTTATWMEFASIQAHMLGILALLAFTGFIIAATFSGCGKE